MTKKRMPPITIKCQIEHVIDKFSPEQTTRAAELYLSMYPKVTRTGDVYEEERRHCNKGG